MSKPVESQLIYKKVLSFTLKQKNAFEVLKKHNVNVNEFITKTKKHKTNPPFLIHVVI